jgi:NAD(P)-dependent dehydrogenase (short-subunit alcohol dehydrogenase family)
MSIIIVGAGPNLGAAIARRFGREGFSVGLVARDRASDRSTCWSIRRCRRPSS